MENLTKKEVDMLGFKKFKPYTPSYYGKKSGALCDGCSYDAIHEASLFLGCSHKEAIERLSV